ncbi:MAG: AAA family ATPase [Spirochaetales bacterium]|nr:AAA family ATPase [Spirochaetales bacterium]
MIIKRVELHSFAGVSGLKLDFSTGLNVIFGENEAGKSTLFNAIIHALFTSSKLSKVRFKKEMERYLPVSGGDTVKVSVDFAAAGGDYSLTKWWGAVTQAELKLPDGSLITDDTRLAERMEQLLPASAAVMQTVLLTYQSGMEKLLDDLKTSGDALFDLREVLRRTLSGESKFNVDRFKARLEREIEDYYRRWDRNAGGPEQGRGIANPWKQGCGTIVTEWYAAEELRRDLEAITAAEDELARIAGDLESARREYDEITVFLASNERAAKFAAVRADTLREIERLEALESRHGAVYEEWPAALARREEITRIVGEKKTAVGTLTGELDATREYDRKRVRFETVEAKIKTVKECLGKADAARREMTSEAALPGESYDALKALESRIKDLERESRGGSLSLTIRAKRKVELKIQSGIEDSKGVVIEDGKEFSSRYGGPVSVDHPDFTVIAGPGDTDVESLRAEYRKAKNALGDMLASIGVHSVEEAAERHRLYVELQREVEVAEGMLQAALGGHTIDELEAELNSPAGKAPARAIEEVQRELTTTELAIKELAKEGSSLERKLEDFESQYGTRDALLNLLVDDREKKKRLTGRLENEPGLPDGFDDWASFVEACSRFRSRRDELADCILEAKTRKAELLAGMPDDSAEGTALRLEVAQARFERVLKQAAALDRVLAKTEELLSTQEIEISAGLKRAFEENLNEITGGRYRTSRFSDDLPDGLLRADGTFLTFDQLSSGTKDGFALALKLAMADYFLKDSDGFIMMDDPLVDMDDTRRPRASSALGRYALKVQTILFTCHENHAVLFDEKNLTRLTR